MCSNHQQEMSRLKAVMLATAAVRDRFPEARLGLAGLAGEGFYLDVDADHPLSDSDLALIEEGMAHRLGESSASSASARKVSRDEAREVLEAGGERFRLEWLDRLQEDSAVWLWQEAGRSEIMGDGPWDEAVRVRPAVRLLSVSGAYWLGDSRNPVLQRIYGVAFGSRRELDEYLARLEEARKRDHRRLGKQLELFMFAEEAPGMPFYLPKGTVMRNELERLSRELLQRYGYEEVRTPFIMNRQLWEQSGHWEHYSGNMYFSEIDHQHFAVKPMNCPGHMLLFKNKLYSYKELPLRLAEFGQVHRYEFSGALNGLFRVRTFCQDDAHIFVTPEQIEDEIMQAVSLIREMYELFGFEYRMELSTRPEDSMGSDEQWAQAESALSRVLEKAGLPYTLNPGDGAFYGPKIDFHIKDALNRSHQCGTVQLDFQMPEKFGLSYVDENGDKRTPTVIHRAVYGSIDRFLGILIEHYGGAFPLWLAPVQVKVLPVSSAHTAYARQVRDALAAAGLRAELDDRGEKLGYRIREAQLQKVPFSIVVGEAEKEAGSVQVRAFGKERQEAYPLTEWIAQLQQKVLNREA